MEHQKKILGTIFIFAGAILTVLLTLLVTLLFTIPSDPMFHPGFYANADVPGMLKILSLAGIIMYALLFALPSIFVGIGLVRQKRWADNLILPLGCFYLLFFPLGTALGIYGLVVFFASRPSNHLPNPSVIDSTPSVRY